MRRFLHTPNQRFTTALLVSIVSTIFFLRYLWSLSLGNGDELFFSTGAGAFNVPDGTLAQWKEFFAWLWWEHTGRTADWLSGAVYFFGDEEGRWIVSTLTAVSAGVITWCLRRFHDYYRGDSSDSWFVAPIALLALLFAYAVRSLISLVNFTMYSAAVCNYLVPTAVIFVVVYIALTTQSLLALYTAAFLAALTATMHEQAAAVLAFLAFLFILHRRSQWALSHRLGTSLLTFAGVIEMFLSPGLHAKLARVAAVAPPTPKPLPHKLAETFYGFSVHFPSLGLLMSIVIAGYLIHTIRRNPQAWWNTALLLGLCLSTAVWRICMAAFALSHPIGSKKTIVLSCMLMMVIWLLAPLMSPEKLARAGTLLLLSAAVSLAIPAAAGLSAVRVYNYPLVFLISFLIWTIFLLVSARKTCHRTDNAFRISVAAVLLSGVLLFTSLWVIAQATIAFQSNFEPGLADLKMQEDHCQQTLCPAQDPALPYPPAMSGYGEHDYASVDAVLEWIEK